MRIGQIGVSRFSGLSKVTTSSGVTSRLIRSQARKPIFSYSRMAARFFTLVSHRTQSHPLRRSICCTSSSTSPPRPAPCIEGCTARRWNTPGRMPQVQLSGTYSGSCPVQRVTAAPISSPSRR